MTLNDIKPGTVLEGMVAKKVTTSVGDAMTIAVVETRNGKRIPMDLMVPERFESLCEEKLPCLLYYDGKKDSKKGNPAHDLRFIPIEDPRMFHDSDEECDFENGDDAMDEEQKDPAKNNLEKSDNVNASQSKEVSAQKQCDTCKDEGQFCTGFCPLCENHQPFNGSQCRCFGFC